MNIDTTQTKILLPEMMMTIMMVMMMTMMMTMVCGGRGGGAQSEHNYGNKIFSTLTLRLQEYSYHRRSFYLEKYTPGNKQQFSC